MRFAEMQNKLTYGQLFSIVWRCYAIGVSIICFAVMALTAIPTAIIDPDQLINIPQALVAIPIVAIGQGLIFGGITAFGLSIYRRWLVFRNKGEPDESVT
jgi:hypothetical protein